MSAEKTGSLLPKISKKDAKMQDGISKLAGEIDDIQRGYRKADSIDGLRKRQYDERSVLEKKQNENSTENISQLQRDLRAQLFDDLSATPLSRGDRLQKLNEVLPHKLDILRQNIKKAEEKHVPLKTLAQTEEWKLLIDRQDKDQKWQNQRDLENKDQQIYATLGGNDEVLKKLAKMVKIAKTSETQEAVQEFVNKWPISYIESLEASARGTLFHKQFVGLLTSETKEKFSDNAYAYSDNLVKSLNKSEIIGVLNSEEKDKRAVISHLGKQQIRDLRDVFESDTTLTANLNEKQKGYLKPTMMEKVGNMFKRGTGHGR